MSDRKTRKCPECCNRNATVIWHSAKETGWRCPDCAAEFSSKKTDKQSKRWLDSMIPNEYTSCSVVSQAFDKKFRKPDGSWRWVGYALIKRVEQWAKLYPRHVTLVSADDEVFASSRIVLIQNRNRLGGYHGCTMIAIPQCRGEISEMFLYPSHHDQLLAALANIKRRNHKRWGHD